MKPDEIRTRLQRIAGPEPGRSRLIPRQRRTADLGPAFVPHVRDTDTHGGTNGHHGFTPTPGADPAPAHDPTPPIPAPGDVPQPAAPPAAGAPAPHPQEQPVAGRRPPPRLQPDAEAPRPGGALPRRNRRGFDTGRLPWSRTPQVETPPVETPPPDGESPPAPSASPAEPAPPGPTPAIRPAAMGSPPGTATPGGLSPTALARATVVSQVAGAARRITPYPWPVEAPPSETDVELDRQMEMVWSGRSPDGSVSGGSTPLMPIGDQGPSRGGVRRPPRRRGTERHRYGRPERRIAPRTMMFTLGAVLLAGAVLFGISHGMVRNPRTGGPTAGASTGASQPVATSVTWPCALTRPATTGAVPPSAKVEFTFALMANWSWYHTPAGFLVAVPQDWRVAAGASVACIYDPSSTLIIGTNSWRSGAVSPAAALSAQERAMVSAGTLPGDTRGALAADPLSKTHAQWSYEYDSPTGRRHVVVRDWIDGGTAYEVSMSTTAFDWSRNASMYDLVSTSFDAATLHPLQR
jgi:hypothetical protein